MGAANSLFASVSLSRVYRWKWKEREKEKDIEQRLDAAGAHARVGGGEGLGPAEQPQSSPVSPGKRIVREASFRGRVSAQRSARRQQQSTNIGTADRFFDDT